MYIYLSINLSSYMDENPFLNAKQWLSVQALKLLIAQLFFFKNGEFR